MCVSCSLCRTVGALGRGWRPRNLTNWGLPQGPRIHLGACGHPEHLTASHQTLRHTWGSPALLGVKTLTSGINTPPPNTNTFKGPLVAWPWPALPASSPATPPRSRLCPRDGHKELLPESVQASLGPACPPSNLNNSHASFQYQLGLQGLWEAFPLEVNPSSVCCLISHIPHPQCTAE